MSTKQDTTQLNKNQEVNKGGYQAPSQLVKLKDEVFVTMDKYFPHQDTEGVKLLLAIAAAHQIEGTSIWVRLIGASRSGRTSFLTALAAHEDSVEVEYITPAAVRGGMKYGQLLQVYANGKLLITKDFATILGKRKEIRLEFSAALRAAKDGRTTSLYNSADTPQTITGKFDWILAVTPVINSVGYKTMGDLLGSRFVDIIWQSEEHRKEKTRQAKKNARKLPMIEAELAEKVVALLTGVKTVLEVSEPPEVDIALEDLLTDIADFTARARTPVDRDYNHRLASVAIPDMGTELVDNLTRLSSAMLLLGEDPVPLTKRLCKDCISYKRAELIQKALSEGTIQSRQLGEGKANQYDLADLKELGVFVVDTVGYKLSPDCSQDALNLFT